VTPIDDRHDIPAEYAEMSGALNSKMGFELLAITPERVVGRMPVAGNTQPYGLWHGGASCVLAETLASMGSHMHAQPNRIAVGVDINATHHRSVTAAYAKLSAAGGVDCRLGQHLQHVISFGSGIHEREPQHCPTFPQRWDAQDLALERQSP